MFSEVNRRSATYSRVFQVVGTVPDGHPTSMPPLACGRDAPRPGRPADARVQRIRAVPLLCPQNRTRILDAACGSPQPAALRHAPGGTAMPVRLALGARKGGAGGTTTAQIGRAHV